MRRQLLRFLNVLQDNTVRLWQIKPEEKEVRCLAVGQGHTHAVGAVAVSRLVDQFSSIYSRTSMARTLMACLPRLFRTRS